ncbi:MAG: beta-galactosidase [Alistipes sp.]|nr:beta-galactosidase [Alistipes sp.]
MKRYLLILLALTSLSITSFAREIYTLNNDWRFFFKEENSSDDARYIRLPHTWHNDSYVAGINRSTSGNYERKLYVPAEWQGRRLFLRFCGVQSVANVFVNGGHVGEHRGGYTAFAFEITERIEFGTDNLLQVLVSNAHRSDILPTSSEATLYGGIYRDVELIVTDKTAISPLYYGTEGVMVHTTSVTTERVDGRVDIALLGKRDASCIVEVDVVSPDGYVATTKSVKAKIDGKLLSVPFSVVNPELWSPSSPNLYTVKVTVGEDAVSVVTGFMDVKVTTDKLLTINGKHSYVRGVNLYHDCASVGTALSEKQYGRDLRSIQDMGATALRSMTGPHAQYLYEECDRRGLLVWIDTPLTQSPFLSDVAYYGTSAFEENGREQLREILLQNCHHPSVVMWGLFSTLRGCSPELLSYIRSLNALAKQLDASRPTVACSNRDGDINFITDLIVWQQSVGWVQGDIEDVSVWQQSLRDNWSHLRQGICYGAGGTLGQHNESFVRRGGGNTPHRIPESWQSRFHEGYARQVDEKLFWGVWLDAMFDYGASRYDVGIKNSGLVTFDHSQRKDAYHLYKALWNRRANTLYIAGKSSDVRMRTKQLLKVYSSCGEPTLLLNGDTVAVRSCQPGVFVSDTISMSGTNEIKAFVADRRDSMVLTIGNYLRRQ